MKWFTPLRKFAYVREQQNGVGAIFYYEEESGPGLMKLNFTVTARVENVGGISCIIRKRQLNPAYVQRDKDLSEDTPNRYFR